MVVAVKKFRWRKAGYDIVAGRLKQAPERGQNMKIIVNDINAGWLCHANCLPATGSEM
jgi:hypothetical protein